MFSEGDRVWYEPVPGIKFAGRVLGDGTLENTRRVRMIGHYGYWKCEKHRILNAPAIHVDFLEARLSHIDAVDAT